MLTLCYYQDGKNKKLPEETSQPTPSGSVRERSASPSTQPPKRKKELPPKGDKGKGKAVGGSKEASTSSLDEWEYEITRWDTGVVFSSNSAFFNLSSKELRLRWRRAMVS